MAKKMPEGKRFSSTHQPVKNGRKPNKYNKLIKENKLSSDDVSNIMSDILQMTKEELVEMQNNKDIPFVIQGFISAIIKDVTDGELKNINSLLDRSIGKVTDKVEHSGAINLPQLVIEGFQADESEDK